MKAPLTPKSYIKPRTPPDQQIKKVESNPNFLTQTIQKPNSQSDLRIKTYFKLNSDNKKKYNISLFNFYINKKPLKTQSHKKFEQTEQKQPKRYKQQESIIKKKIKQTFSSLSTEKLQLSSTNSKERLQKIIQKQAYIQQELLIQKQLADKNTNKINENFTKNPKFDRKKYMYYRYRKKNSTQKNIVPTNQICEKSSIPHHLKAEKKMLNGMIVNGGEMMNIQEKQEGQNINFKYSFFGVMPPKNSFSQATCKLTIQPISRQASSKIGHRKNVSKTSRQSRSNKQSSLNEDKIFVQAIHFKSRKPTNPRTKFSKQNPQKHDRSKKQQQILGWNMGQSAANYEEQYF